MSAPESLNALMIPDMLQLRQELRALQDDEQVRCIVLTRAGDRAFCTGANLKETLPPSGLFAKGALLGRMAEAGRDGLELETSHLAPRDCIARANLHWGLLRDSKDRIEGREAFAEKRTPNYIGD